MHNIQQIRQGLIWGIPLCLGVAAGCILMISHEIVPTLKAIASIAPAVRISPAAQLAPFIAVTCLIGMVVACMRAIPCSDRVIKSSERAANIAVIASGVALLMVPVTAVSVRYYMPSLGYTICADLQDNPTMWFTDWVRDPAWCVKGKSLDWVNEQASTPQAKP
ncbi:hypothetical protein [Acidovorax sp. SUPP3334]|uniref:hypothetical protein n=1 Tax=Acidovorax sp. SUPP3334 TaxID=2920881 RepID=UPI0023DE31FD|nr:hypothetical protein [Acidovorax sp. SUPP3334]GKT21433.1 hypothetical protein AVHM3334_04760 [Acidovorax sp. SUPP3334]